MNIIAYFCTLLLFLAVPLTQDAVQAAPWSKIISASVVADEILWDLLGPAEARRRVPSFSPLAANPDYSCLYDQNLPQLAFGAELEKLALLKPDIVLLSPFNHANYLENLTRLKVPYLVLEEAKEISEIAKLIAMIGKYLGKDKVAAQINAQMSARLAAIKQQNKTTAKRALIIGSGNLFPGRGTLAGAALAAAQLTNAAALPQQEGWHGIDSETLVSLPVDVLVLPIKHAEKPADAAQALSNDPLWGKLLRKKSPPRVITIPSRLIFSGSPRIIDALELLHRSAYEI